MNRTNLCTASLVALLLAVTAGMTDAAAQQSAPAPRRGAEAAREGIGVSGYWKIDVRNPDGSLASHTEFENALTNDGQVSLVNAIFGASTFSAIAIQLTGPIDHGPCVHTVLGLSIPVPCFIEGAAVTSAVQLNPVGALVLTGSTTATNTGFINAVATITGLACGTGIVPCGPPGINVPFTAFSLGGEGNPVQPISVSAGQLIQVSVTLSFS